MALLLFIKLLEFYTDHGMADMRRVSTLIIVSDPNTRQLAHDMSIEG
jgi:hypothetical protein